MPDFDPNAYADAVEKGASAGAFDPNAYADSLEARPRVPGPAVAPKPRLSESRARGAFQGLTGGYGDELSAALAAALPFLDKEAAKGNTLGDRYQHARDFYRGLNKSAKDANPGNYTTSEVLAGLAAAPFLPGAAASLPAALATGTGYGALSALGSSDADLLRGQYAQAGKDTSLGAVLGLGGGALGYGVSRGLRALPGLQSFANRKALNALGAMKPELNQLGSDAAQTLGQAALDEGVVTPLASRATMAARAQAGRTAAGRDIGNALSQLDAAALPSEQANTYAAAQEVENLADKLKSKPALRAIADKFRNQAEIIRETPPASGELLPGGSGSTLTEFEKNIARPYKQTTNWNTDLALPKETLKQLPSTLEAHVERQAQAIADRTGSDAFSAYQAGKGRYGTFSDLLDIAEEGLKRQASNHTFGLKEGLAGIAGAATGAAHHGPVGGIVMGGASMLGGKLLNRFGDQMAATGADRAAAIGRWLAQNPQLLSKLSGQSPAFVRSVLGSLLGGGQGESP